MTRQVGVFNLILSTSCFGWEHLAAMDGTFDFAPFPSHQLSFNLWLTLGHLLFVNIQLYANNWIILRQFFRAISAKVFLYCWICNDSRELVRLRAQHHCYEIKQSPSGQSLCSKWPTKALSTNMKSWRKLEANFWSNFWSKPQRERFLLGAFFGHIFWTKLQRERFLLGGDFCSRLLSRLLIMWGNI